MLCIYYIQESGQPQCRSDKLFVNIRFSVGKTRRTDGKRPADRTACEEAGFLPYVLLMTRCPTGLGGIHP